MIRHTNLVSNRLAVSRAENQIIDCRVYVSVVCVYVC